MRTIGETFPGSCHSYLYQVFMSSSNIFNHIKFWYEILCLYLSEQIQDFFVSMSFFHNFLHIPWFQCIIFSVVKDDSFDHSKWSGFPLINECRELFLEWTSLNSAFGKCSCWVYIPWKYIYSEISIIIYNQSLTTFLTTWFLWFSLRVFSG